MFNIIVVLSKPEAARGVRNLLMKNGFRVDSVCATGSQALSRMDDLNDGLVICSYRMSDMMYSELHACLPKGFEMLLLASANVLQECDLRGIMSLAMPLKVYDLINTVNMMGQAIERRKRREKQRPRERSVQEEGIIREAKELLMSRNHMTEEEAHRYLQKCSMDSGTNLVEEAQMVLAMMRG